MSLWIQQKYARLLPLQNAEYKGGSSFINFRCTICGDSRKSSKKRAWFLIRDGGLKYHCYNCGYNSKFHYFLKEHFPHLYEEYLREYLQDSGFKTPSKPKDEPNFFQATQVSLDLQKVIELPINHQVNKYCENRNIPLSKIKDFYYSDNFYNWCKMKQPDNFEYEYDSDKRIIFPLIDRNGVIFGVQGRSIEGKEPKYLTMKFREDYPKVFGWDKLDLHQTVYVVEGPIDSLFLPNAIAVAGALSNIKDILKFIGVMKYENVVIVPDNERRNKQTCKFIEGVIKDGFSVVIWPESVTKKDINDLIISGMSEQKILDLIKGNCYKGIVASLKFNQWRR
jgi:hypothetical protein